MIAARGYGGGGCATYGVLTYGAVSRSAAACHAFILGSAFLNKAWAGDLFERIHATAVTR
ncbi:hypothetical protein ACSBM8_14275 [Sphingomonas sp. ASY06-1R]|uniref:hypothetical protein n=1 Tax=Sphingomonas sp. ASY06-1R TaxID=3445771 RepID=UPI003FA25E0E